MRHDKMEFVKPHMIIGVDFGMTCTSHSKSTWTRELCLPERPYRFGPGAFFVVYSSFRPVEALTQILLQVLVYLTPICQLGQTL